MSTDHEGAAAAAATPIATEGDVRLLRALAGSYRRLGTLADRLAAHRCPPVETAPKHAVLVDAFMAELYEFRGGAQWHPEDDERMDELLADAHRLADVALAALGKPS